MDTLDIYRLIRLVNTDAGRKVVVGHMQVSGLEDYYCIAREMKFPEDNQKYFCDLQKGVDTEGNIAFGTPTFRSGLVVEGNAAMVGVFFGGINSTSCQIPLSTEIARMYDLLSGDQRYAIQEIALGSFGVRNAIIPEAMIRFCHGQTVPFEPAEIREGYQHTLAGRVTLAALEQQGISKRWD